MTDQTQARKSVYSEHHEVSEAFIGVELLLKLHREGGRQI
jgi:hypothetical protein